MRNLNCFIGKKIVEIKAEVFVFDGKVSENPNAVVFKFENGEFVKISCGADGDSINFTNDGLECVDMGEFGKIEILNVSDKFGGICGCNIENIAMLYSNLGKIDTQKVIGVGFICNVTRVYLTNLGDELIVSNNLADDVFEVLLQ